MPLVRLEVRNEFGLGQPQLYRETNREDPKAVLDGVAVAGLVGILRQLGDLADFAAEVFHGLQEQVMTTASRSHRLMIRVQNIEASLPPLEKAVLAQTSHIHFAYTAGCEWHPRTKTARNHFIYNDLPHFIMDSYEESRDPPRLQLLDKFETGGPGSCFRKYSDPTFFKRVSADSDEPYSEKTGKARKSHKYKKKKSSRRNGERLRGEQMHSTSGRSHFISSSINGRISSQTTSTIDMTMKSDLEDRSNSFDSKSGADYIECVFHPSRSMQLDEQNCEEPSSSRLTQKTDTFQSSSSPVDDNISHDSLEKKIASSSSGVTWDEKEEIVESMSQACDTDKTPERLVENHDSDMHSNEAVSITNIDYNDILFNEERNPKPVFSEVQPGEIDSEPDTYMDALNSIESESEIDLDYETKREVQQLASLVINGIVENRVTEAPSHLFDNNLSNVSQNGFSLPLNKETGEDIPDSLQDNDPLISEHASNLGSVSPLDISDNEEMIRDTVSSNTDTIMDLPNSLQEIHPLTSKPHASDLGPLNTSDILYTEGIINGHTVSSNKETFENFPNSVPEVLPLASETHASILGYASIPDVSVSKEMAKNVAGSHSSDSPICERDFHTHEKSVLDHSVGTDTSIDSHTINASVSELAETDTSLSGCKGSNLPDEEAGKINNSEDASFSGSKRSNLPDGEAGKIDNTEDARIESLGDHSVGFWTNGGLLGLEPSKPPDFNMSSSLKQVPLSMKSEMDGGSRGNSIQKSNGYKEGQELSGEGSEQILKDSSSRFLTSDHNDVQASIFEKASCGFQLSNGQTERNSLRETGVVAPGSVLPAASNKKKSPEPNQGNGENSSHVFGLGHRLLSKSFNRKVSFDEKFEPYNSLKSILLEQNGQNGIVEHSHPKTTFKEKVSSGYPINSLPPSPPLEHMKISFHPVSELETSKLKLKFPEGSNHHESIRDMFPSFQLVPESSIPLDNSVSHSDGDDTFCRSSPYVSDDCQTPRSDYDSDQWESDETPGSSDHGVHDSLNRNSSSTESMSSTKEHARISTDDTSIKNGQCTSNMNGVETSLSGPLLDFPSFDNVNPVLEKESNRHSENNAAMSHSHPEPARPPPPPPPIPPLQWRVTKPQLDEPNEAQNNMSEDATHINDQCLPESTIFQQVRLAEVDQLQINHKGHESYDIIHKLKEKLDPQKLKGQKESANQLRMGKEMDEKEDFLYQIRTKSFNLRPTVTAKPNATIGPAANVKVTAILEKANAIRQVVASDDGEDDDDNWSDT